MIKLEPSSRKECINIKGNRYFKDKVAGLGASRQ